MSLKLPVLATNVGGNPELIKDKHNGFLVEKGNYIDFANRLSIPIVSVNRQIDDNGSFTSLNMNAIESIVLKEKPNGLLFIPYDNPTGQF